MHLHMFPRKLMCANPHHFINASHAGCGETWRWRSSSWIQTLNHYVTWWLQALRATMTVRIVVTNPPPLKRCRFPSRFVLKNMPKTEVHPHSARPPPPHLELLPAPLLPLALRHLRHLLSQRDHQQASKMQFLLPGPLRDVKIVWVPSCHEPRNLSMICMAVP